MLRLFLLCLLFFCQLSLAGAEAPQEFERVRGVVQITRTWRVELADEFAKRYVEGENGTDLVLWRPGITCWTNAYGPKEGETPEQTLAWRKSKTPKGAVKVFEAVEKKPLRYGYLLRETPKGEAERWGLYTFTFGESGHVMMAIYFDQEKDLKTATAIWMSVEEKEP
ncbi:hypothetical protein [Prosthecobacter sp.]|uniref:hypothetical protein n=1 Tax=Prosthecobacter sp. TaxID=1965333 RepID=UPI003783CAAC